MPTVPALVSENAYHASKTSWWLEAPAWQRSIAAQASRPLSSACYRLGDAVLQIASDDREFLALFNRFYGDCTRPAPVGPEAVPIRCIVWRGLQVPLLLLTFQEWAPTDPAAIALSLLRATPVAPPYAVYDSPLPGWRLAGGREQPVLAACDRHALIDLRRVPPDFLVDYLVSVTFAAQPELLVIHAASLCIGAAGLLLVGSSHAGKTTTALHLAARGHTLLGDEAAAIRLTTNEIVPVRRAANLRPGPRTPELLKVLEQHTGREELSRDGRWIRPLQIGALFPHTLAHPVPLRAVFFLDGFADYPSCVSGQFTLHETDLVDCLASNDIAYTSWGLTPTRRTLRLLALKRMLARLPCWTLQIGAPLETAQLIERTMEELGC